MVELSRRATQEAMRDEEIRHWYTAALFVVVCIGGLARYWQLNSSWLWYDEVFGATFAEQSLVDLTVASVRFDIHPPAWSWQLYLWAIGGQGDTYLLSNSIAWSVASIVLVYVVVARCQNRRIALLAAILFAVMPVSIAYARMLRMYSMLMFFLVLGWYANMRYLQNGATKHWLAIALSQLVLAYSHGTGILLNFYLGLFGLLFYYTSELPRSLLRRWLGWQTLLAVLSVGGLANAVVRKVSHTQAPDPEQILNTLADFLFGPQTSQFPLAGWAALGVMMSIIWFGLMFRTSQRETIAWLLVPLVTTLIISYTVKPLWHLHAIVPFSPFVAIVLAQIVYSVHVKVKESDNVPWVLPLAASLLLVVAEVLLAGWHLTHFRKETEYPWVAEQLSEELQKGDLVYVPQLPDFWGVARYTIGADWGSLLEIQDLEPTQDRWGKLVQGLSPQWRERLHLEPQADYVEYGEYRIYTGMTTGERLAAREPERILVVQTRQPELPVVAGYEKFKVDVHHDIQVIHMRPVKKLRSGTGFNRKSAFGNLTHAPLVLSH
jgi:hypothetical protein